MRSKKTILAVASAGGHWTQINLLSEAFDGCDVHYVTTNLNRGITQNKKNISIVIDADLSTKFKLIPLALQTLLILIRRRPDIIISTGAAPGFFAILFGKCLGAKTIWVDSLANLDRLSVSGQQAQRFCDLCLTQWPNLTDQNKVQYFGSLL